MFKLLPRTPYERFKQSITKDNLWVYILTLLKKKEGYPYEIKTKIEKEFNFKPGNVTPYIVFKKLEINGYIKISKIEKDKGPEKTYYKITEKGEEELEKAIKFFKSHVKILRKR